MSSRYLVTATPSSTHLPREDMRPPRQFDRLRADIARHRHKQPSTRCRDQRRPHVDSQAIEPKHECPGPSSSCRNPSSAWKIDRTRGGPARSLYDSLPVEPSMAATYDYFRRSRAGGSPGRLCLRLDNETVLL